MVGVVLGKAFPYPQRVQVWCFARGPAGRSRGMEPAGPTDGAALAVAAFRVYAPPRPGCRFSRFLGPLPRVLALVAYASRAEPGSYRGEVERPQVLDVQAKLQGVKVGARIAPNAFATADGGDCTEAPQVCRPRGVSFLGSTKSVPPSYPTAAAP